MIRFPLLTVLGAALLAVGLAFTPPGERLELRTQDLRFRLQPPRPHTRIVLVTIGESTQAAWQDTPTVFWGGHLAQVIKRLKAAGARAIALDLVPAVNADDYLENVGANPASLPDAALESALTEPGAPVFLTYVRNPSLLPNTRFRSLPALQGRLGFVDFPSAADDVIRQGWREYPNEPARASLPELLAREVAPVHSAPNPFWIGVEGEFPRIPAERMAAAPTPADAAQVRDAVVLIGVESAGFKDLHQLPGFREAVIGSQVHADAFASLVEDRWLRRPPPAVEALIGLAVGLLAGALVTRLSFGWGLLAALGGTAVWWAAATVAFSRASLLLPMTIPTMGILLSWVSYNLGRSLTEAAARRQVERVFGRYLSPEIRDYLLHSAKNQRLGGALISATILFFDLRGSTEMAENRPADDVLADLNTLFHEIAPVVERHGGLINRFLGDGFLALFGVPYPLGEDPQAGWDAAAEICEATDRLNRERSARGLRPWRIGIGLHRGPIVAGSLGSGSRAEYTVIGDAVNLTARLESMNKELRSRVVVSSAVWERLRPDDRLEGPLEVSVRGRKGLVVIYRWKAEGEDA